MNIMPIMNNNPTLQNKYNHLAYAILEKAKQQKRMRKQEYKNTVLPYFTILRSNPITETELIAGIKAQHIQLVK